MYGKGGICISDFCGISPRCLLFSAVDDFSGNYMISPMVPSKFTNVTCGKIILNKYCQVGANSIVMPNVIFDEGAVCGAFSFIKNSLKKWSIYCGIPAKKIKNRSKKILDFDIK